MTSTIPIVVHQDAGPCSKTKSADTISWSSMISQGGEKITKFLIATSIANRENDNKVWRVILDDMMLAATSGIAGWKFVLLFAKADEEQRSQKWGLPHYSDDTEICSESLCNRDNRPFTDLSRDARWRQTERIPKELYFCRIRNKPKHPLATSKYFTRWFLSWTACTCSTVKAFHILCSEV